MAGYLKTTCGVQQMVSNGNEGYRVQGAYDPYASTAYPFNVRRKWFMLRKHLQLTSITKQDELQRLLFSDRPVCTDLA